MASNPLSRSHLTNDVWRSLILSLGRRRLRYLFASGSHIVDWPHAALVAGWDSSSLRILAGLDKPPNEFEVDHHLEAALEEADARLPSGDLLADLYAVAIAREIVAGSITPYDGAGEDWSVIGCAPETITSGTRGVAGSRS
jgi:hypothetical protein